MSSVFDTGFSKYINTGFSEYIKISNRNVFISRKLDSRKPDSRKPKEELPGFKGRINFRIFPDSHPPKNISRDTPKSIKNNRDDDNSEELSIEYKKVCDVKTTRLLEIKIIQCDESGDIFFTATWMSVPNIKDHPLDSGIGTDGSLTNILTRRLRYEALEYLCKKSEYGSLHVEDLTTIPTVTSEDLAHEL